LIVREKEATAFIAVGSSAAAVHFLVVWLLVHWTPVSPAWANVPAFWIAFAVSYSGHNFFTFAGRSRSRQRSILRWMAVSIGGFLLNQALYVTALYLLAEVHYLILLFIVTGMVTFVTFFLGKYWAFTGSQPQ
jgi:putative flippase GtrA